MEFSVESMSPTKKKLCVTLTVDEVNSALDVTVAEYGKNFLLPGFRKGKVPSSVIEKRFDGEIQSKATREKLNTVVATILDERKLKPLFNLKAEDYVFVRNKEFTCTLFFEVLPEINFPEYEGLLVEQEKVVVTEEDVKGIINNVRVAMADLVEVKEARFPQDGDRVDVNYSGSENGSVVDGVQGEHFIVVLGQKQALDDFEALVKATRLGEEMEGPVVFPENYGNQDLAGRVLQFKVKVNSIKEPILPEIDEAFAKKAGYEDLETLMKEAKEHITNTKKQQTKANSAKKLVLQLLEKVSFEIPETMLENKVERILGDQNVRGEQPEEAPDKNSEKYKLAEERAKEELYPQIFLMALAEKEGLVVLDHEVETALRIMAERARQDYKVFRDAYYRSGLVFELRDIMLADKAMEYIYGKASVVEVDQEKTSDAV